MPNWIIVAPRRDGAPTVSKWSGPRTAGEPVPDASEGLDRVSDGRGAVSTAVRRRTGRRDGLRASGSLHGAGRTGSARALRVAGRGSGAGAAGRRAAHGRRRMVPRRRRVRNADQPRPVPAISRSGVRLGLRPVRNRRPSRLPAATTSRPRAGRPGLRSGRGGDRQCALSRLAFGTLDHLAGQNVGKLEAVALAAVAIGVTRPDRLGTS